MKRTSGYFISAANNRLPRENSQKSFIYVTYNMVYLNVNRQSKTAFISLFIPANTSLLSRT